MSQKAGAKGVPQAENTCTTGSYLESVGVTVINSVTAAAVNLNQTSSFAVPAHPARVCVAYNPFPETELQVAAGVTVVAFAQSSFTTGFTTHVLNVIVS